MIRRTFLALTASTMLAVPAFAGSHSKDIVDTAIGAGSFATLVAAVEAAGLVAPLLVSAIEAVFAAADVSEQEPFTAMGRLGLKIVNPSDV